MFIWFYIYDHIVVHIYEILKLNGCFVQINDKIYVCVKKFNKYF